jgi:cyclopropane fatty-acyl-phospholipid synthase-like methyltransferase
LVPGCGKGHEVRALAGQSDCAAVGLDLSPLAIEEARRLAAQAGAAASFIVGDFFHLPSEIKGTFDWLVEHTCFCAIDPLQRADYVLAAASALRAGGKIFGIFYLNPGTESGPPFAVSREELSGLFEPHFTLLEQWTPRESFPDREDREWVAIWQKR